jgi:enterochelin esterase family protein
MIPWRQAQASEIVARLRLAAARGESADAIWAAIREHPIPVVEAADEYPTAAIVTFLCRADPAIGSVRLCEGLAFGETDRFALQNIPRTDIWYISLLLPRTTRVTYGFSRWCDSPARVSSEQEDSAAAALDRRIAFRQPDLLNPRAIQYPCNTAQPGIWGRTVSLLELPDAPLQPWSSGCASVRQGSVTLHNFQSRVLGKTKSVYVYAPANHESGARLPLAIMLDGWLLVEIACVQNTLDSLIAEGRIPPLVAVMPDSGSLADRKDELYFSPAFSSFLARELTDWACRELNATCDTRKWLIGGASAGGVASLYTALNNPDVFGKVFSLLGSVGAPKHGTIDALIREFLESPRREFKAFVEAGLLDNDPIGDIPGILDANRRLRMVLKDRGYEVIYRETAAGHDWMCIRESLAEALQALF